MTAGGCGMIRTCVACAVLVAFVLAAGGCGRGRSIEAIHDDLMQKLETGKAVEIAWGEEQKKHSSMAESKRGEFENSFSGKKIRTKIKIKEYKPADMSQFQKAFSAFDYYAKEKFNFNRLMVVVGNGPNYGSIETSYVVFLPNKHMFDFSKQQEITVEGLVDSVSFTFYNCHILLYPARLVAK